MALSVGNVTFDAADPAALSQFWAAALEREAPQHHNPAISAVGLDGGVTMLFIKVPEPKTAKNRCHLDLRAGSRDNVDAEAARLQELGATLVREPQEEYGVYWATLQDPEGNEFCIGDM